MHAILQQVRNENQRPVQTIFNFPYVICKGQFLAAYEKASLGTTNLKLVLDIMMNFQEYTTKRFLILTIRIWPLIAFTDNFLL